MTESKVDVIAWIRNTPADNGWKAKERDAVANAVDGLIEALKLCSAVCAGETMSKSGLVRALEASRAALAACTPAKSEGR